MELDRENIIKIVSSLKIIKEEQCVYNVISQNLQWQCLIGSVIL